MNLLTTPLNIQETITSSRALNFSGTPADFWISFLILLIAVVGDIGYRFAIKQKPELVSTEIIIFSLVHTLYQLSGIYFLGHPSLWGTSTFLVIKTILLFILFIATMSIYQRIQIALDNHIVGVFQQLMNSHNPKHLLIQKIQNIARNYIEAQLWVNATQENEKAKKRSEIIELLKDIEIDSISPEELMIPERQRNNFRRGIKLIVAICLFVGLFPV